MSVLHIVLLILKIVGLLLLILLGIAVSLLLLLLFVPFRYQINLLKTSEEENSFHGRFCMHWFFHILHVKGVYTGKGINYCFRIFGIPIKQKKSGKQITTKEKQKDKKAVDNNSTTVNKKVNNNNRKVSEQNKSIETKKITKEQSKEQIVTVEKKDKQKKSIKAWITNKIQIVQEKIRKIRNKLRNIKEMIKKLIEKKNKVIAFLKEETTKNSLRKSRKSVIKLLKYVGPQKMKGVITYGFEDPSQTGMSLGIISVLYAYYSSKNKKLKVIPDFEQARFEADVKINGRFRMVRVLFEAIKLIQDKEFKAFMEHGKRLKEEF